MANGSVQKENVIDQQCPYCLYWWDPRGYSKHLDNCAAKGLIEERDDFREFWEKTVINSDSDIDPDTWLNRVTKGIGNNGNSMDEKEIESETMTDQNEIKEAVKEVLAEENNNGDNDLVCTICGNKDKEKLTDTNSIKTYHQESRTWESLPANDRMNLLQHDYYCHACNGVFNNE